MLFFWQNLCTEVQKVTLFTVIIIYSKQRGFTFALMTTTVFSTYECQNQTPPAAMRTTLFKGLPN